MNYENMEYELDSIFEDDDDIFGSAYESDYGYDSGYDDIADEGFFFKPKSTEKLLAQVQKKANKLKSVEDCDDLLSKLKTEAAKFNECLKGMQDAAKSFKNGEITKKELSAKIKPYSKELKNSCSILTLGKVVNDNRNVTDEEIQKVRDFIKGATDIIKTKKNELKSGGSASEGCGSKSSCESFAELYSFLDSQYQIAAEGTEFEGYEFEDITLESTLTDDVLDMYEDYGYDYEDVYDDYAVEAYGNRDAWKTRTGAMKKEAVSLVKQARKAFKTAKKNKDVSGINEAIKIMTQAKNTFSKMLKDLHGKLPKNQYDKRYYDDQTWLKKGSVNASSFARSILDWCEKNMYKCDAAITKYKEVAVKIKNAQSASESYFGIGDFLDDLDLATEGTGYDEYYDDSSDPFADFEDDFNDDGYYYL